jgi:hypothetical protein
VVRLVAVFIMPWVWVGVYYLGIMGDGSEWSFFMDSAYWYGASSWRFNNQLI